MNKYPKVTIIILNWNRWKDTIECLESVFQNTYPNYEVIIVDNGSKDNSVEMIKKWADGKEKISSPYFQYSIKNKPIKYFEYTKKELETEQYLKGKQKLDSLPSNKKLFILKNDKNYGFAEGNNIAITQIINEKISEFILFLNNDTVVTNNFLLNLIKPFDLKNIGITGSKNKYYSEPTKLWYAGGKFFYYLGGLVNQIFYKNLILPVDVDYVSGSSLLIKVDILIKEKLDFNKSYFSYYEDTELCFLVKKLGHKVKYVPDSVIYHKVGKSTQQSGQYFYLNTRNRILFVKRMFNPIQFYIFSLSYFIFRFPLHFYKSLRSRYVSHFLRGLTDGYLLS